MRVNDRHVSFYYENDMDMGPIEIDPKKTALLVIDMQHVFITRPERSANPTEAELREIERWEPFYSKIEEVVIPNNAKLLKAFREKGIEVAFAKIQCQKKNGADRSLDQKATGYNELLLPPGTGHYVTYPDENNKFYSLKFESSAATTAPTLLLNCILSQWCINSLNFCHPADARYAMPITNSNREIVEGVLAPK